MKKVGVEHEGKLFTYQQVFSDANGWVDAKVYAPVDFDLCDLKMEDGKILPGWISQNRWDGLNVKRAHKVVYWRKKEERHYNVKPLYMKD